MATYTKTCPNCGRRFTTKIFWAIYCSTRCKVAAWRKQQKVRATAEQVGQRK